MHDHECAWLQFRHRQDSPFQLSGVELKSQLPGCERTNDILFTNWEKRDPPALELFGVCDATRSSSASNSAGHRSHSSKCGKIRSKLIGTLSSRDTYSCVCISTATSRRRSMEFIQGVWESRIPTHIESRPHDLDHWRLEPSPSMQIPIPGWVPAAGKHLF